MGYSPPHTTPHGQKRQPDNEIDHEQRLSKRFNLLNLEQNGSKLYIPVKSEAESSRPSPPRRRRSNAVTDTMPVEDSKEKVYIHNLDEEIADIESEDEKVIFLPDIERHLMKIPKSVLTGGTLKPGLDNQMILYSVPGSISVPEEQDAVRKAIEEARRRAQEEADQDMQPDLEARSGAEKRANYGEEDQDAMDTE